MSVGRLAAQTGVSSRTIRYYEELGILPPPPRSAGGTRMYPGAYRFYVEGALALKELGFNLDKIRLLGGLALGSELSDEEREQAERVVNDTSAVLEHKLRVLVRLMEILQKPRTDRDAEARMARFDDLFGQMRNTANDQPEHGPRPATSEGAGR